MVAVYTVTANPATKKKMILYEGKI